MKNQVLFIQGGGDGGGYEAGAKLVGSLQSVLGEDYKVSYPELRTDKAAPDFGWLKQIGDEINKPGDDVILVAHSLGASLLLKYLSENEISKKIAGIFLVATPYWTGDEQWVQGLKLKDNFAEGLPKDIPIFFYHARDDEEVPFEQFTAYKHKAPQATFHEIKSGGHQLGNDLSLLAKDIKGLQA